MTACHTDSANDCHQESLYLQAITDIIKSNGWAKYFFQGQMEGAIKPTEKHIGNASSYIKKKKKEKVTMIPC